MTTPLLPTKQLPDATVHVKLTLRALPGWPSPGDVRLRMALKALLRGYGLRCERVEPMPDDGTTIPILERNDA